MQFLIRTLLILVAAVFVFSESVAAAIVFKPGKKPDFVMPGEEEISGNAAELFQIAQSAERDGNIKRAIKAYKSLVKRHPKDALAPGAAWRAGNRGQARRRLKPTRRWWTSFHTSRSRPMLNIRSAISGLKLREPAQKTPLPSPMPEPPFRISFFAIPPARKRGKHAPTLN